MKKPDRSLLDLQSLQEQLISAAVKEQSVSGKSEAWKNLWHAAQHVTYAIIAKLDPEAVETVNQTGKATMLDLHGRMNGAAPCKEATPPLVKRA